MIAQSFDAFLFDLDGVVYVGEQALTGAPEALKKLRQMNKIIRFVTNNPCTTREKVKEKLARLNIEANVDEVVTASSATAEYLFKKNITNAYILGDEHLKSECERYDIIHTESCAEAVVVGWDGKVTFNEIATVSRLIRNGAYFIATNEDKTFPMRDGPAPATGTIVRAIETASEKRAIIIGKPYAAMFQTAMNGIHKHQKAIMIGDTPTTDILGAHQFGIPAILIGNESNDFQNVQDILEKPDVTIPNLTELFNASINMI